MRSSVPRGPADLQISGAPRRGHLAIAVQLGWKEVKPRDVVTNTLRRGWSGTKCGGVMRLSRCGCAVGVERSAAAVATELGKRRIHKVQACALNVLGMR
jgi:hypothetical protein